ncbi:MAG: hypothetical protein QNJ87_05455 [Gammaproteobacteria bacterium]|nr:hypothetical protein [Gammaproteobacteria bacterium]
MSAHQGSQAGGQQVGSRHAKVEAEMDEKGVVLRIMAAFLLAVPISGCAEARLDSPEQQAPENSLFREPLKCIGTEPFWSLEVDSRVRFARLGESPSTLSGSPSTLSSNHTNVWFLEAQGERGELVPLFLRRTDQCSDDMSDFSYRYEIYLQIQGKVYSGCCNRLP